MTLLFKQVAGLISETMNDIMVITSKGRKVQKAMCATSA